MRVIIVGGGIIGIATAYYLARRDVEVVVLDDTDLDRSASTGNAGLIALGHGPLPRPGLVMKTIKWMLDPASPLYVPLRLDPSLIAWMWQSRAACSEAHYRRTCAIMADLGLPAGACFDEILADGAIDCAYAKRGWLDVYGTGPALDAGRRDAELLADAGYTITVLSTGQLLEREPALAGPIAGAVHHEQSATIEPGSFLRGFAALAEQYGATIRRNTPVTDLVRDGGTIRAAHTAAGEDVAGDAVVLCAGAWSTPLAAGIGVRVPMQAGKGYHVNVPQLDPPLTTGVVLAENHVAATPMGDFVRIAGTVELSGLNLHLHPRRVAMLTEAALPFLPGLAHVEASEGWCGLRPCTADGLPVMGPAPGVDNLYLATGHAKQGFTLGPLTGKLIAEWIVDGEPSLDVSAMSAARFGGDSHRR